MTLPDVGVLQSAALIGYLFGQVSLFSLTIPVLLLSANLHVVGMLNMDSTLHQC